VNFANFYFSIVAVISSDCTFKFNVYEYVYIALHLLSISENYNHKKNASRKSEVNCKLYFKFSAPSNEIILL